jgi:hypothetical protein
MKKLFITGIFTLFLTYFSYSQLDTVYFDSYNDNRTGWAKDTEANASKIENGNYIWTRKQAGEWATWWEIGGVNAEEFLFETRFRIEGDGAFGFIWDQKISTIQTTSWSAMPGLQNHISKAGITHPSSRKTSL